MAILKAIDPKKYKAKGIVNIVSYVMRKHNESLSHEDKLIYCGINVNPLNAAEEMENTKDFWNKHGGREYFHLIQSFSPDDNITIKQANEITKKFVLSCPEFDDYEVLIATHHDKKNHIDSHIIINAVSYSTGRKFHYTRACLADWKKKQDEMNVSLGLHKAPEKGFTFDGKKRTEIVSNDRKTFEIVKKAIEKKGESYIHNCAKAVYGIVKNAKAGNRKEFIKMMDEKGFRCEWKNTRKNITFVSKALESEGKKKCKIRLSRLFSIYNRQEFTKEGIEKSFSIAKEKESYAMWSKKLSSMNPDKFAKWCNTDFRKMENDATLIAIAAALRLDFNGYLKCLSDVRDSAAQKKIFGLMNDNLIGTKVANEILKIIHEANERNKSQPPFKVIATKLAKDARAYMDTSTSPAMSEWRGIRKAVGNIAAKMPSPAKENDIGSELVALNAALDALLNEYNNALGKADSRRLAILTAQIEAKRKAIARLQQKEREEQSREL